MSSSKEDDLLKLIYSDVPKAFTFALFFPLVHEPRSTYDHLTFQFLCPIFSQLLFLDLNLERFSVNFKEVFLSVGTDLSMSTQVPSFLSGIFASFFS